MFERRKVTYSPVPTFMVAVRMPVLPVLLEVDSEQLRAVRSQPVTAASVTAQVPGTMFGQVTVFGSVGSERRRRQAHRACGGHDVAEMKSWASLGTESLMIVIEPRLESVKVQVTLSPGSRMIVATAVPRLPVLLESVQESPVRAHPAGMLVSVML